MSAAIARVEIVRAATETTDTKFDNGGQAEACPFLFSDVNEWLKAFSQDTCLNFLLLNEVKIEFFNKQRFCSLGEGLKFRS